MTFRLTAVDMRVPCQQLKQHVAAGPSGMRIEYLRCLVGEYTPASGHAAVHAMSEVASIYIQGRMPGWFNRLFAFAKLVAPVKKLGEGGARPDLGIGVSAGDCMLIYGVRLIAEKLGPRAVIVHTDPRNASNEAWRLAMIQCHIDCSPLHHVIPALLASLSPYSYLVVDDRSAPLRSESGVQQGAPLATTSFCVAIHPEVQQRDITLEVIDGAARFNADDGYFVGLPEHVWSALQAFRTPITASVGLKVRFDKMHAYIVDMEAAQREAPADIEWPELDGHHGIPVLNVPPHLRPKHCKPDAVRISVWIDLALAAVERVLGVSFDPSTYGNDTNPLVTDFLAELWHDPGPMAAELQRNFFRLPRRYDHFLNDARGSASYTAAVSETWGRLQAATAGHLNDADALVMEREAEVASGSQKELTPFLGHANNSRLRNQVCALLVTCRERILFNQLDAASGMWMVAIPTARTVMTPHELREVAAGYFFLPSPCLAPVVSSPIIPLPSTKHNPVTVNLYGDALMNLSAPGDAHWRVQHDAIADAFRRDHCAHDPGIAVRREVDDYLFQQAVPLGNTCAVSHAWLRIGVPSHRAGHSVHHPGSP
eukprot:jgi/Tetstr1/442476/TSEL_030576.t1